MSKGPGLYSDIGKKAKDLLTKDYNSDQKLTVSSYSTTGVRHPWRLGWFWESDIEVTDGEIRSMLKIIKKRGNSLLSLLLKVITQALTSTALKKGGLSTGDVAGQYKYKNTLIDVKIETASIINTTLTFTDLFPSTKTIASIKLPDYSSGKLEVQYFHDHATLTSVATLKQSPIFDVSATVGSPTLAFGAEAGYDTKSGSFTKYNTGISFTKLDSSASVIIGDKGDSIKVSYLHHLDQIKKSAAVVDITRRFSTNQNTITVGGSFAVDPLTQIKARFNNQGKVGGLLQHELFPKSVLTISGEVDTKALEKKPKFGLAIALKP